MAVKDYIRESFFPQIWCAGCGNGIVMNSLIRAIENLGFQQNQMAVVSGIGCTARMSGYLDFHTLHTLHGRALAFATGIKLSRPELKVVVPMGDGDAAAIGGNHFVHAARRNIDLTAIVINNSIYGMTGGQFSPLTAFGKKGTTVPYGNVDSCFDLVNLARGAGATFVARTTTYHAPQMTKMLEKAIAHKGFSVVEILSQCPTYYGRKNKLGGPVEMMNHFKEITTTIDSEAKKKNPELIERGIFVQEERLEYCQAYDQVIAKAMKKRGGHV
ncbi:MAG: 2-oxoacid:ferredoxin oxidoreductase subunit beta [Deltaproteobacteria bacterium]|nr:2-oxoacid:ferredoxin oxidoreductase subunit beta [Deltaproteobacteria bacterium]